MTFDLTIWAEIEYQWRMGYHGRLLAREYGISEAAIRKRAKVEGWTRDLQALKRELVKAALAGAPRPQYPVVRKSARSVPQPAEPKKAMEAPLESAAGLHSVTMKVTQPPPHTEGKGMVITTTPTASLDPHLSRDRIDLVPGGAEEVVNILGVPPGTPVAGAYAPPGIMVAITPGGALLHAGRGILWAGKDHIDFMVAGLRLVLIIDVKRADPQKPVTPPKATTPGLARLAGHFRK